MCGNDSHRLRRIFGFAAASLFVLALGALFATVRAGAGEASAIAGPLSPPPGPVVNDIQTVSFGAFVPCANGGAGEAVVGTVELHVLVTSTRNGNTFSGMYHYQPAGGDLVGSVTGDSYRPTGVTRTSFGGSFENGRYTTTFVNNFRIVGQGAGNNYLVHETDHLTIDASGNVTVDHGTFTSECR